MTRRQHVFDLKYFLIFIETLLALPRLDVALVDEDIEEDESLREAASCC
jgi:hypothetical protein